MGSNSLPHGRRVPGSRPRRSAEQADCFSCNTGRPADSVQTERPAGVGPIAPAVVAANPVAT